MDGSDFRERRSCLPGAEVCPRGKGISQMQQMDDVTFGVTMLIVGMGGTIVTLWIMSLIMTVLMKVFPYKEEEQPK